MYTVPMFMPSRALEQIMEQSMRELFDTDPNLFLQTYGISITYEYINDGKSMLKFILPYGVIPYCVSYVIIVASMRRSILPLVVLSVPVSIVTYGTIADANLGLATLPLTGFVWLVPIVQVTSL
ncbi:hypothetical protein PFISCL1PPCAC_7375, partial [Pristionchus fissidentatus]